MTPDQEKALRAELDEARAESAGRLRVLNEKAEEVWREWTRAERAETALAAAQGALGRVETWTHVYGAALVPREGVADTYGEGMRNAKTQVRAILDAALPTSGKPGGELCRWPGAVNGGPVIAWCDRPLGHDGEHERSRPAKPEPGGEALGACGLEEKPHEFDQDKCVGWKPAPAPPEGHPAPGDGLCLTTDELSYLTGWLEGELESLAEDDPGTPLRPSIRSAYEKLHLEWTRRVAPKVLDGRTPAPGAGEQRKGEE